MTSAVTYRIRAATASDRDGIRSLLTASSLPTADLDSAPDLGFWVAEEFGQLIATIGLERYGASGLLRSLVVSASRRRSGLGRELVATVECAALKADIELLVLLTETAERFFMSLGYATVDRGYLPDDIKESAEFRSLCPGSAVCMTKSLVSVSLRGTP
jgi:amino-acid N-acetyltransferase